MQVRLGRLRRLHAPATNVSYRTRMQRAIKSKCILSRLDRGSMERELVVGIYWNAKDMGTRDSPARVFRACCGFSDSGFPRGMISDSLSG